MNNRTFHFLQLGFSIVVMSSSGALGRFISLPVPATIWVRCLLGGLALYLFLWARKSKIWIGWGKGFWFVVLSSALLGAHWVTYFWALKLSNVAVGMLSLFTYPVITALIEPLITRSSFKLVDVLLALGAFVGVFFLVPAYDLANSTTQGILMGILSALLYSIRNIMLKRSVTTHSGTLLMFYQLAVVTIMLMPVLFIYPSTSLIGTFKTEWLQILILAFFTTALGHTLLVRSFAHFSITAVSVMTSLTPLFGIAWGYFFLQEKPTEQVLIGGSIILAAVVVESVRSSIRR